jgi:hypothetical protein
MPRYKVELFSIDRNDESKDIEFVTFVDAPDQESARLKAKEYQKLKKPEINVADNWSWSVSETAEDK